MRTPSIPLARQVIVVTGASSGIGLATARRAAARGAAMVLVSRNGEALGTLARQIETGGGRALAVTADVADEAAVAGVVTAAIGAFGRIDTWVNNAGVAAYGTLAELPLAEHRRIFETNYWGTVHGSLAAIRHFRERPGPGRLINVGSINSDIAVPLLSAYSASKHAVKGFTDALRRELLASDPTIAVTLVKPAGIATALPHHARNHLGAEPRIVPPLYPPELVARAILDSAETPRREIVVGAVGAALAGPLALAPRLMDRLIARAVPALSTSSHPLSRRDNLDTPTRGLEVHDPFDPSLPFSPYTELQLRPGRRARAALAVGLAALVLRRLTRR